MKAILVDDEPDGIRSLQKMLELNCPDVEITATCSNATDARKKLLQINPDVVFLDILMPGQSGLDMLRKLPEKNFEVIFVTAHNEYIRQALEFSAVDYLTKPVEEERLTEAVQRVRKRLGQQKATARSETLMHNINNAGAPMEMMLCLPNMKGFTMIKLEEVVCCEAGRSYTIFHTVNKPIMVSKPLVDYEKLLSDTPFFRVHKSFLINLMHIKEYMRGEGGSVIMSNGMEIEVSRRKKEQFLVKIKELFRF